MTKTIYCTTPIYYVNSNPHIGHAYTTIVTDAIIRFRRLFGEDAYFLTGTDEHGQKIAESAAQAGLEPQAFVDVMTQKFKEMWPELHIEPDQFIRTTEERHKTAVQQVLQQIYDKGEIFLEEYDGFYCVGCEEFLNESELVEGNCPVHQKAPEYRKEQNYFFRMSAYQDWLIQHLQDNPEWIYPARYRNEVLKFLDNPLQDLCISRPKSRLTWGIELPFDSNFVTYVWFDALLNYATALDFPDGELFKRYWPAVHHIVGKDILKTHAIYWPCMLKAAGMAPFSRLIVHGHWVSAGSKMSKTLGNVVDPLAMKSRLGVDGLRYFLVRDMSFGEDANFTEELAISRYNADLANNLGNLLNRSINMSRSNFDGTVPPLGELSTDEELLRQQFTQGIEQVRAYVQQFYLHKGLEHIAWLGSQVNTYLQNQAPWKLAKQPDQRERLGTVLHTALDMTRILVGLLSPVMPEKMKQAAQGLGLSQVPQLEDLRLDGLTAGTTLPAPVPLFPKLQPPQPALPLQESPPVQAEPADALHISIDEFDKVVIKVGEIKRCEPVPKSDKLLQSYVDLGEAELRSIVSGVANRFSPHEMLGKRVLVVSNLKPTKLRGVLSEGMILFAESERGFEFVTVPESAALGSIVR
jgi:methionyl-tRNA synthetase